MKVLKYLIWIYLGLLLGEGVLRKWILPGLSNPLLIVRDPIAILIYAQAFRLKLFPTNIWMMLIGAVAFTCLLVGLLSEFVNPLVVAFGMRTDFLHLPLIFVMSRAFDEDDVKRVGKVFLLAAMPMALLMALQFRADPHNWLNAGAGGGGQLSSALGKIRPAGTFSFISGPIFFFATVSAFVIYSLLTRGSYPLWLTAVAGGSTIVASAVSGSRSLLGAVALVVVTMFAAFGLYPRAMLGAVRVAIVFGVLFVALSGTQIFREGQTVMTARIENASGGQDGRRQFIQRLLSTFMPPDVVLFDTPMFGKGLGLGTNAGAGLIGMGGRFLLAEGEWARVYSESGPLAGSAFILLRVSLEIYLIVSAVIAARNGRILPLLLLGATGLGFVNGAWGQPTSQGFASFLSGLCLASMRAALEPKTALSAAAETVEEASSKRLASMEPARAFIPVQRSYPRRDISQPGRFAIRS